MYDVYMPCQVMWSLERNVAWLCGRKAGTIAPTPIYLSQSYRALRVVAKRYVLSLDVPLVLVQLAYAT